MTHDLELDLMRLLHGELPAGEERALRDRLGRDPGLARRYRRLEAAWARLSALPAAPVPLGFSGRVMAHVRSLAGDAGALGARAPLAPAPVPAVTPTRPLGNPAAPRPAPFSWSAMPTWVRATGAGALVAGLLLGAGLGVRPPADDRSGPASGLPGLAESYWTLVDTADAAAQPDGGWRVTPPAEAPR